MAVNVDRIAALEAQLDAFDPAARAEAVAALAGMAREGLIAAPPAGDETNVHSHTFFSYNAYGYSPSGFAWRAWRRGLAVAGTVDFDVLHGLEETIEAGRMLGLRTTSGMETRVFIPELRDKEINSPKEPGVWYFMGTAFPRVPPGESPAGRTLARMHALAQERNRGVIARVNAYLGKATIDYEQDVIPLTPSRNPTERHLLRAYDRKARALLGGAAAAFWGEALRIGEDRARALLDDPPRLHEAMRSALMKAGSPGYAAPEAGAFPALREAAAMVKDAAGLPTATWLDGTSAGEADIDALLDFLLGEGIVAVNIIPERNWNIPDPAARALKVRKLGECIEACRARDIPVIAGTEMNKHGQPFADNFAVDELAPYVHDFLGGALALYGHTMLARCGPWSYGGAWAADAFGPAGLADGRRRRNEFYQAVGAAGPLPAEKCARLAAFKVDAAPRALLDAAGREN